MRREPKLSPRTSTDSHAFWGVDLRVTFSGLSKISLESERYGQSSIPSLATIQNVIAVPCASRQSSVLGSRRLRHIVRIRRITRF
jgi:hypothetical protein